ncbi:hypothetical protein [Fimbriiglobus ruber]|uniref:Uncharacterized protein n=1 Tax=Fimbriiglobus ruber TaxID=1908690 RepID=A0A225D8F0_9BACT|nr:hypothetical protein [Fimbriiglobus ruber]OWK37831.1 hypothetical protein FRUB_06951 [Fimbriiglobus ruber]
MAKLTVTHQPPRHADGRPSAVIEGFGGVLTDFLFCEAASSPGVRYTLNWLDQTIAGDGVIDWAGNVFLITGDRDRVSVIEDEDIMGRPEHRCELPTQEFRTLLVEWAAALESEGW